MRFTVAIAFVASIGQAVKLLPGIPDDILAQTESESYKKTYPKEKYASAYGKCPNDCPVDECTGITQLPGPCTAVIENAPLEYNNVGWMHTDWEHHIDITKPPVDYGYEYEYPDYGYDDYECECDDYGYGDPYYENTYDYKPYNTYKEPYGYEDPYYEPYEEPHYDPYYEPYEEPYEKPYYEPYEEPYEEPYKKPYGMGYLRSEAPDTTVEGTGEDAATETGGDQ